MQQPPRFEHDDGRVEDVNEPLLKTVTPLELLSRKPAVPVVEGIVYDNTICQLAGAPGSYKSFISIGIAVAVAAGRASWEGHKVKRYGPVVYVAAEGEYGLGLRIGAACEANGISVEDLEGRLITVDGAVQMNDPFEMAALTEIVLNAGAVLVIWDTRARCTADLDENSATEQGKAIRAIDKLRRDTGAAQFIDHHMPKTGLSGRGSNAWNGAIWSDLIIEKKDMTATITVLKHKDVPSGDPMEFDLKPFTIDQTLMPGANESQRTSLVAIQHDELGGNGGFFPNSSVAEERVLHWMETESNPDGETYGNIVKALENHEDDNVRTSSGATRRALGVLVNRGDLHRTKAGRSSKYTVSRGNLLDTQ